MNIKVKLILLIGNAILFGTNIQRYIQIIIEQRTFDILTHIIGLFAILVTGVAVLLMSKLIIEGVHDKCLQ